MKKLSVLLVLLTLISLLHAQEVKILSHNTSSITISYTPEYYDTSFFFEKGERCFEVKIPDTYYKYSNGVGSSAVPVKEIKIGVQSEFGNTIQIISKDYSSIDSRYSNEELNQDNQRNEINSFETKENNIGEPVTFGEFGLIRNLQIQSILIYPIKYNPTLKKTQLLKKVVFQISIATSNNKREKISDMDLSPLVVNWNEAQNWGLIQKRLNKSKSFLAEGNWYRFETPTENIYKIDAQFLIKLGIDVNTIDPKTIKIYGNGGYALPENPDSSRPPGFNEIAVQFFGNDNAKFEGDEYILFYGRGIEFWDYNKARRKIERVKNPYSEVNYYWLTYGGDNGKRVGNLESLNEQTAFHQPNTLAFKSIDKDSINIGKSGREYFGDILTKSSNVKLYVTSLKSIDINTPIEYKFKVANISAPTVTLNIYESNQQIYSGNIYGISDYYFGIGKEGNMKFSGSLNNETSNLKFTFSTLGADASIAIDYIEMKYRRQMTAYDDYCLVFSDDTSAVINYHISNFSNSSIYAYDVTDYTNVKLITGGVINGNNIDFQCSETKKNVKRYLIVNPNSYKTPINPKKIQNSGLRLNKTGTELIIITNKTFREQVERYASYRSNESPNKISTSIFYVDEIYNEFSNGMADPTAIRDFLKFAYDNWQIKPFYVLLFGDGTYDILNKEKADNDFVPTYQTQESLYEMNSYPTDDYYARISGSDKSIDLGIGRLCVNNIEEARIAVDKIIKYENKSEGGLWRNRITLVADDGPAGLGKDNGKLHTEQSEILSDLIPNTFDLNKIYLAAYPTVITGIGRRKPEVNKSIVNSINEGTLILNFIGHGSPGLWTDEIVFDKSTTIPQLHNEDYFFLTAATCDFGKYDDPDIQSSTELLLNKENAGAIAAFSSARVVISDYNAKINNSLFSDLFKLKNGKMPPRLGNAYMVAKESFTGENDEKFHLFGDPTIRLKQPELSVNIDSINGALLDSVIQINALSTVKINGSVRNHDGKKVDINGQAILSVYDSQRKLYLKEMDYSVNLQGGLLYRGISTVNNGVFRTEFVVPKDISYENKYGKISAYVFNDNIDGIGYSDSIRVGGANVNAVNDGEGPQIEIYFDNDTNNESYLVNEDFTLIAKLNDETGINTTGTGIGHKLECVLNDDVSNTIDLTNYFIGDLNSGGKSGVIKYKFLSKEPGDYKIHIKAWDVFNNFSFADAYVTVVPESEGSVIRDLYNYPNPFRDNTTFTFNHNNLENVNVTIKIYTIAGRLIKKIEDYDIPNKFVRIDWDGRDEDGNLAANGTYLYKVSLETSDGINRSTVLGKLSIMR